MTHYSNHFDWTNFVLLTRLWPIHYFRFTYRNNFNSSNFFDTPELVWHDKCDKWCSENRNVGRPVWEDKNTAKLPGQFLNWISIWIQWIFFHAHKKTVRISQVDFPIHEASAILPFGFLLNTQMLLFYLKKKKTNFRTLIWVC